jgi:magnesium transporter
MTTKKIDKKTKESKQTKKNNGLKQKITLKVPLIYPEQTLQEAQDILLKKLKNKEIETINYFYVIDQNKKLIGLFSIKELFLCDLKTKVKEVMKTQLIKADPQTDQEQVAYLALKNNIKAVPIVNQDNVFLGILTSDQILDILDKETSEDLLHLAGFYEPSQSFSLKNNLSIPILKSIKNRLPWLIVGLFGGILAARIINLFTNSLEKNLILAMLFH